MENNGILNHLDRILLNNIQDDKFKDTLPALSPEALTTLMVNMVINWCNNRVKPDIPEEKLNSLIAEICTNVINNSIEYFMHNPIKE